MRLWGLCMCLCLLARVCVCVPASVCDDTPAQWRIDRPANKRARSSDKAQIQSRTFGRPPDNESYAHHFNTCHVHPSSMSVRPFVRSSVRSFIRPSGLCECVCPSGFALINKPDDYGYMGYSVPGGAGKLACPHSLTELAIRTIAQPLLIAFIRLP